jgi:hypothetical protein
MKKTFIERLTARFRKNRLYSALLALTGRPLKGNWIFIVGCYNSGTTLLNELLAGHPDISGVADEGVMLTNKLTRPEDFGWRRMWWKCEENMAVADQEKSASVIKKHWSHFYKAGTLFYLEKSISNSCRMLFFEKYFNHPRFIHIVRNGYAVAEGIHRKAKVIPNPELPSVTQYPIEYCIKQWTRSLELVEADSKNVKHFLEIRYEELCMDPSNTVNKIFSFLGLRPIDQDFFKREFAVHHKTSSISNMNRDSIQRLAPGDIRKIEEVAGEVLKRYGYTKEV